MDKESISRLSYLLFLVSIINLATLITLSSFPTLDIEWNKISLSTAISILSMLGLIVDIVFIYIKLQLERVPCSKSLDCTCKTCKLSNKL